MRPFCESRSSRSSMKLSVSHSCKEGGGGGGVTVTGEVMRQADGPQAVLALTELSRAPEIRMAESGEKASETTSPRWPSTLYCRPQEMPLSSARRSRSSADRLDASHIWERGAHAVRRWQPEQGRQEAAHLDGRIAPRGSEQLLLLTPRRGKQAARMARGGGVERRRERGGRGTRRARAAAQGRSRGP